MLWGQDYYFPGNNTVPCYRWPALNCDGSWNALQTPRTELLQWYQYQVETGCFVGNSVLGQCETLEKYNDDDSAEIAGRADALRRVLG